MKNNYELTSPLVPLLIKGEGNWRVWRNFLIPFLLIIMSIMLLTCTQFPKDTEKGNSVGVELVWKIQVSKKYEVRSMKYEVRSKKYEVKSMKYEDKEEGKNSLLSNSHFLLPKGQFSIKSTYEEIQKAGITIVALRAEADGQILQEKSFPVDARKGILNNLPSKNVNITAEARDKTDKTLFRGSGNANLSNGGNIKITITMNETPEYYASRPTGTTTTTPSIIACESPPTGGIQGGDIEMVSIPAGEFLMGSTDSDTDANLDEKPQHTVYLDSYQISKYEITQEQYKKFMDATGHSAPTGDWEPSSKANYPVTYIDWNDAKAFCEWAGGRLPTEAEWEKAARGTDERKYPWGNNSPGNSLLNFNNNKGGTTSVGSYPSGASPYGVMDMAGNVWEWCSDWYDGNYYSSSPNSNPQGPNGGSGRVDRGGSWVNNAAYVRCSYRYLNDPSNRYGDLGFRLLRTD